MFIEYRTITMGRMLWMMFSLVGRSFALPALYGPGQIGLPVSIYVHNMHKFYGARRTGKYVYNMDDIESILQCIRFSELVSKPAALTQTEFHSTLR